MQYVHCRVALRPLSTMRTREPRPSESFTPNATSIDSISFQLMLLCVGWANTASNVLRCFLDTF